LLPEEVGHCSLRGTAKYRRTHKKKIAQLEKFDNEGKPKVLETAIGKNRDWRGIAAF
jgi:hypothetical protein